MARAPRFLLRERDIQGLKCLRAFQDLLEPLRQVPVHGNRQFFMDQYAARLKDISAYEVPEDRSLTEADWAAGVIWDQQARMGLAFTEASPFILKFTLFKTVTRV
jgi:hypothetical protein